MQQVDHYYFNQIKIMGKSARQLAQAISKKYKLPSQVKI